MAEWSIEKLYLSQDQAGFVNGGPSRDNVERICHIINFVQRTKIPFFCFFVMLKKPLIGYNVIL